MSILIEKILKNTKNIAVVGLSDKKDRASYQIAFYLKSQGFRIIPINPNITKVFGEKSYPNISSVPMEIKIDLIDVFRRSDEIIPLIKEVLKTGRKPVIWLQEGIFNSEAEKFAKRSGLNLISGICLMKAHQK